MRLCHSNYQLYLPIISWRKLLQEVLQGSCFTRCFLFYKCLSKFPLILKLNYTLLEIDLTATVFIKMCMLCIKNLNILVFLFLFFRLATSTTSYHLCRKYARFILLSHKLVSCNGENSSRVLSLSWAWDIPLSAILRTIR